MPKKFDELQKAILSKLKSEHPDWDKDKLENSSYSIAVSQYKKKYGSNPTSENNKIKKDSSGNIIVGENVKLILEANITSVGVIEE